MRVYFGYPKLLTFFSFYIYFLFLKRREMGGQMHELAEKKKKKSKDKTEKERQAVAIVATLKKNKHHAMYTYKTKINTKKKYPHSLHLCFQCFR